ncbi:DUF6639 family protein [Halomonas sp. RA08-2]|uniref:DUF6639 family protein n=1 Tax=Halomonas sp. RA08-2 TaxID=3440842 RepID=UPI003EEE9123
MITLRAGGDGRPPAPGWAPIVAVAVLLATLSITTTTVAEVQAGRFTCPRYGVQVIASDPADARDACSGAAASLDFLVAAGLQPARPIVVEVVPELPEAAGPTAAGSYLVADNRVLILPFCRFLAWQTWFEVPIDRRLYRSLAAHEVAHGVVTYHFSMAEPSIQAQEYLAYVVTFASMPPELLEQVLEALPGEGFAGEERITELFYLFHPMHFGAQAYRHYLRPGNGVAFLNQVLAGNALR